MFGVSKYCDECGCYVGCVSGTLEFTLVGLIQKLDTIIFNYGDKVDKGRILCKSCSSRNVKDCIARSDNEK